MSKSDSKVSGFALAVLVLCAVAFGVSYLMPSSGSAAPGLSTPMAAPAAPVRLVVPALKLRAPIQPIEVNARVLDPPRNPRDVGWWKSSARPGAKQGQTVLTGHTVHTGGGVMDDLGKLRKNQMVKVVTRKGPMVYRTTKVVTWTKDRARQASGRHLRPGPRRGAPRADHLQPVDGSLQEQRRRLRRPLGVREPRSVLAG